MEVIAMGTTERRAREKEELRRRIVDAASRLFVEQGHQNVSMRKIAEEIEYSPATLYLYFPDKNSILGAICHETFEKLDEALDAIPLLGKPPLESMRLSLRQYIDFGLAHPDHYLVTFGIPELQKPDLCSNDLHDAILGAGMRSFQKLKDGLLQCQALGVIRQEDGDLQAQSVWAMIHGITSILITCPTFPFVDRETLIKSTLDKIMAGLAPCSH
jgi:AcrR family transcriptional regulator